MLEQPVTHLSRARPENATQPDGIRVLGARDHNLRGVSLSIPSRRITVFTGVSGSGSPRSCSTSPSRAPRSDIGLHPHDVSRLTDLLRTPRDKGNTVLVVEHDPE